MEQMNYIVPQSTDKYSEKCLKEIVILYSNIQKSILALKFFNSEGGIYIKSLSKFIYLVVDYKSYKELQQRFTDKQRNKLVNEGRSVHIWRNKLNSIKIYYNEKRVNKKELLKGYKIKGNSLQLILKEWVWEEKQDIKYPDYTEREINLYNINGQVDGIKMTDKTICIFEYKTFRIKELILLDRIQTLLYMLASYNLFNKQVTGILQYTKELKREYLYQDDFKLLYDCLNFINSCELIKNG